MSAKNVDEKDVDRDLARKRAQFWMGGPSSNGVDHFVTWRPKDTCKPTRIGGRAIIICCDGTGNHPKQTEGELPAATNVYLLSEALTSKTQFGTQQLTWYDPGVGTGTSRAAQKAGLFTRILRTFVRALPEGLTAYCDKFFRLFESATGAWIEENIEQGYREIVRNYEPGDAIFIFGFSRGAFTARCIAAVIDRAGLLKAENIRFVPEVMTLFRRRWDTAERSLVHPSMIHPPELVRIEVLGLWDTVASLGMPLWGWWFRVGELWRNQNLDSNPASICRNVYHAMAMDERRSQFFPTVTTPPLGTKKNPGQYIEQTWFRGAHADIGGGYSNRTLGDIGLEWMLQIAHFHGLSVRNDLDYVAAGPDEVPICPKADPMGNMHDEMESVKGWAVFGSWPRWSPVYRPYWRDQFQDRCAEEYGAPHDLVYRRADHAAQLWRRRLTHLQADGGIPAVPTVDQRMCRDGLIFLNVGQAVLVQIDAHRMWNRTAVVFESAAIYRISYVSGEWRDLENPACRAAGQKPAGLDLARRLFKRSRRTLEGDWLTLFGHVAHPRRWPVAEFDVHKLIAFLFWRNPEPLTKSLIQLGKHLAGPDDSVYVMNLSHNGIFYGFANDAWATYRNNSGALVLKVERVAAVEIGAPSYVLTPRGEVAPFHVEIKNSMKDRAKSEEGRHNNGVGPIASLVENRSKILAATGAQRAWPDLAEVRPDTTLAAWPAVRVKDLPPEAFAFSSAVEIFGAPPSYDRLPGLKEIDDKIKLQVDELRPEEEKEKERKAQGSTPSAAPGPSPVSDINQTYRLDESVKFKTTRWSADWARDDV